MTASDPLAAPLLIVAGAVAGVLNVVAGGGSFLTLPLLIFLGVPATVANATNRVGVVAQGVGAVWGFSRHRVMDWRWALVVSVPAMVGALLGTWAALAVREDTFKRALAFFMIVMTLWTLLDPLGHVHRRYPRSARSPLVVLGFFGVGLYGGFVQAGVGFVVLAVTTYAGLDLVRGNAIKVLSVLVLTLLSLVVFASAGKVDWGLGLALAIGNTVGGLFGVRITVRKGHRWLKGAVAATTVAFAILLWFQ